MMWSSDDLKRRFKGVESDCTELLVEVDPSASQLSIGEKEAYLNGMKISFKIFQAALEDRFPELLTDVYNQSPSRVCSQCNARTYNKTDVKCWNCHGVIYTK